MAASQMSSVVRHLRGIIHRQRVADRPDGDLLQLFIRDRNELAFQSLVLRYGPMVLGVCRRILGNQHDAEDAFQATFLILVRKAASIRPRSMVGNWLYGVACRTAMEARRAAAKRRIKERHVNVMPKPQASQPDPWSEMQPMLDQELSRLPDKYRAILLLCDLEGKTRKEAAGQLDLPEGTVASRLARARAILAKRLARHGVELASVSTALVLSKDAPAPASVPTALVESTVRLAMVFGTSQAAAVGVVPAKVFSLTKGVLKSMLLTKLTIAASVLAVAALTGGGLALVVNASTAPAQTEPTQQATPNKQEANVATKASITATSLADVFAGNEAAADEEFVGKRLTVTGEFSRIYRESFSEDGRMVRQYILEFSFPIAPTALNEPRSALLQFPFGLDARKELAALRPGAQTVSIEGTCRGKQVGRNGAILVRFDDCKLAKATNPE